MKILFLFFVMTITIAGFGQFKELSVQIPKGFTILDSVSGDLNKDGNKDLIVILRNDLEQMDLDTTRPLLIFKGNSKGQYQLVSRNDRVVLCFNCGGVHGDPYEHITIKDGFFSIEHMGGSGWRWTRVITFRYRQKTKDFVLHKDGGYYWHLTEKPSKNAKGQFYNKEDFGKLSFQQFDYKKNF